MPNTSKKQKTNHVQKHDGTKDIKKDDIRGDVIDKVKASMLPEKKYIDSSDLFKILGDFNRIRIIEALSKEELYVNELVDLLGVGQSTVSHHLRYLRSSGLVKYRKQNKKIFYSIVHNEIVELLRLNLILLDLK
ncbi:MAG: metalloregulator ArsR/SmtB family transcription factor [Methanobrevibacter sp.]|jgi:ArsR family transcriptional regulator|nr:metalloregulator ArsR/SmtB family transcription factor [Candidatus Methanovirga meridionalis]